MKIQATGFSHRGTIRTNNEDAVLMHQEVFCTGSRDQVVSGISRFFVADGVGGSPAGEIASKYVLSRLNDVFSPGQFPDTLELEEGFRNINARLFEYCELNKQHFGMATTLSGVFFSHEEFRVFNVGDSRVLMFRDGKISRLTTDDVLESHPPSSVLINYFGGYQDSLHLNIEEKTEPLKSGDVFLISTDGLFHCFALDQLEKILANSKTLSEKASAVLQRSLEMGAPDNISCIFIGISRD